MDPATRALTEALPDGIPDTLAARAAHFNVPLSTLGHRKLYRESMQAKAQKQRYLTLYEANAVVEFVLQLVTAVISVYAPKQICSAEGTLL
jgi:hypothetical protein